MCEMCQLMSGSPNQGQNQNRIGQNWHNGEIFKEGQNQRQRGNWQNGQNKGNNSNGSNVHVHIVRNGDIQLQIVYF